MDGHIMRCGTIGSCQSAATSEIVKRCWSRVWLMYGAIASVQTFTFTDGQADRHRRTAQAALCIASRGNNDNNMVLMTVGCDNYKCIITQRNIVFPQSNERSIRDCPPLRICCRDIKMYRTTGHWLSIRHAILGADKGAVYRRNTAVIIEHRS